MPQKITLSILISVAASDGECHAISTDWESSDLHIDFASEFSMISVMLNLEVLLLFHFQWQGGRESFVYRLLQVQSVYTSSYISSSCPTVRIQ